MLHGILSLAADHTCILVLPQGNEFVLASAAHGCELARVRCSSWRRPLAFTAPCPSRPAAFSLAFIQARAVQLRRRRPPPSVGANPEPYGGAPTAEGSLCGLRTGDGQPGQVGGGGLGGSVGRSSALPSAVPSARSDGPPQHNAGPGRALGGAAPNGSAASAGSDGVAKQGLGLAQPYALHAPHHGLDVTCVLALPMECVAGEAGTLYPSCPVAARAGGSGAGGACPGPSLPMTAVVTGSDDGTVRRLVHGGRCGGEPCMQGFKNPAQNPLAAAEALRKAGAERHGAEKCSSSGRCGAWGSAEVGAHVGGATVKALAAVPWPPRSGALGILACDENVVIETLLNGKSQVLTCVCIFA